MSAIARGKDKFLAVVARLGPPGIDDAGAVSALSAVGDEIDSLPAMLRGQDGGYTGLVHGDACPDNTHITGGDCRIFDFETSGWGPVALDAAYLLAPFPSCWCFASLPVEAAAVADLAAQLHRHGGTGRRAAPSRLLTAALHEQLSLRWPEATVPDYPAFARPGALLARLPRGWESE